MYKLTLTASERRAIDWIGNRYEHGDELFDLLYEDDVIWSCPYWESDQDCTFTISEVVAWEIRRLLEGCSFALITEEFRGKLLDFCDQVV